MIAISLQSGSNGNCTYVQAGGVRLLFDAGLSGAMAERRLSLYEHDIREVNAVIISHDHHDHVRCAGVYHRMFGLPIYITQKTLQAARRRIGPLERFHTFAAGETIRFDGVSVDTIPTPHDGIDGVAFVVNAGKKRLGILTDLGHVFPGLGEAVRELDALLIESNYDPEMLDRGPYPGFLKQRIRGPSGHISNVESAELLRAWAGRRMKWACLAHLSEVNNDPRLALDTHRSMWAGRTPLYLAGRDAPTTILEL